MRGMERELGERLAVLAIDAPVADLRRLWFVAEEADRNEEEKKGRSWGKGWEHFFTYEKFKIQLVTGGGAMEKFGNLIGDLARDSNNFQYWDFMRFYLNLGRSVMAKTEVGSRKYVEARELVVEMKYIWLEAIGRIRNPYQALSQLISFGDEFKSIEADEMVIDQAGKVLGRVPEYRLIATAYPFPRKIGGLPGEYTGRKKIEAHKRGDDDWWSLVWLAKYAKEKSLIRVLERVDSYLREAIERVDLDRVDGRVVSCLLMYYGESDRVSEIEKRETISKCLTAFSGKEGHYGEEPVVRAAIDVLLSLNDFEGAIGLWKSYPEYAGATVVLSDLAAYALEHDLESRLRKERSWYKEMTNEVDDGRFSKWRMTWNFAVRRLAEKGILALGIAEVYENLLARDPIDLDFFARAARENPRETELTAAVRSAIERKIAELRNWKKEEEWESFPYHDMQNVIQTILILRGEIE